MNNHFFYSYQGNKRREYETLKPFINLDGITDIYESFCGSSAISFMIWKEHKNKFNYHLNDNDTNLINIYKYFIDNDIDDIYKKLNDIKNTIKNKQDYDSLKNSINFNKKTFNITQDNFIYYLFFNKCYEMRAGLYKRNLHTSRDLKPNKELLLFLEFIKSPNVFITCNNWIDDFKDDEKNLYIYDPPYILSDNTFYSNCYVNANVYEYFFYNPLSNFKCRIIFILELNFIIKLLFKDFIKTIYSKTYQLTKKITEHCFICNF